MFAKKELNELGERKRLLQLEADLHRGLIGLECENLRARLAPLKDARERLVAGGPWLMAGSAVAGLLAVRHWRKLAAWLPAAFTAMRWLKKLRQG